jgi:hypothetical protein
LPQRQGLVVGAVVEERLQLIMYTGVKTHYFPKHKEHVERIIQSISMLSGEKPPGQRVAEPSTATEARVEPTAATSKSEQPPARSKPEQAPTALEKVEPAPVPSPALGAFASIAGTWLGRFEFGATRRSGVGDWPLTLNVREDGSYEAFGSTRSAGKAQIVDGKFVFQLDTGSQVETFTLGLREHGGKRFLNGPNQDGSLLLQLAK